MQASMLSYSSPSSGCSRPEGWRLKSDVAYCAYAGGTTTAASASDARRGFLANEHIAGLLERLRREPALRAWVLTAPTGALATLGVVLDDNELVLLLEQIEELDERALPVTARDIMTPDPVTLQPDTSVHEAAADAVRTPHQRRAGGQRGRQHRRASSASTT